MKEALFYKKIKNKITNQILLIKKIHKIDLKEEVEVASRQIEKTNYVQTLLGIEGNIANKYFPILFQSYDWNRRSPQTKEDITNLLMDIGHTYLFNYVDSLLRLFGFDTYKGFYHQLFFQRKSLSCDVMEVFRPLIDMTILKAYNLKVIDAKDFTFKNGTYSLKFEGKIRNKYSKIFFDVITEHKEEIYTYLRFFYLHLMNPTKYKFPTYILP